MAEADLGGYKGPGTHCLKLAEQKVVRKVRAFLYLATKYFPKMSYFALKSSTKQTNLKTS